jgi:uroporphyrinogen-III synthase
LQQRFNFSEREAYQRLRDESRRLRKPLRAIAEAILLVEEVVQNDHSTGNQGSSEANTDK